VISFDDMRRLFGLPQDHEDVVAVLARVGKVTWTKPEGGSRYAVAKQAGFDILVERAKAGKRGSPMVVNTIFLYGEGASKHRQFGNPPYGLAFTTRAELLASMPKPERTWKIGKGAVPVTTKEVSHDRWLIDGLRVFANYDAAGRVTKIIVSLPGDE